MSKVMMEVMEPEDLDGKPSPMRGMPNALKDGNNSGPPTLFRHTSMERIRHCCQNLNLLPYLLYSFDNSKSHPIARKVHLCLARFLEVITVKVFFLCKSFRQSMILDIRSVEYEARAEIQKPETYKSLKFRSICQEKRKQSNPLFLIFAVYLAPLLLVFQLVGLLSLMVLGKYTPGFIFLISALLFLGCISLKIIFHETVAHAVKPVKMKVQ